MPVQFSIRAVDSASIARLQHDIAVPRLVAAVLVSRGLDDSDAARDFLDPSLERDWLNPYDIPGLAAVVDVLEEAVLARKHVVVFGDFDLDGISATTVLTRGLRALGARATPFIPRRFEEGYGLTSAAYERAKELDPDLIVTVDCGISCKEEVAAIVDDGVSVAVTDHHEAGENVPVDVPVADPKLDSSCGSAILAGVGVALKLVQALGARRGYPHLWRSYTDLAALGTIADLMPMRGENRALVADGLAHINKNPRPCLAALINTANAMDKPLTSLNLGFTISPRLNAAGRMGDATTALDLLMCDNFSEACRLAERLEEVNEQRRAIESDLTEAAQKQALEAYHGQRVLVVSGQGWHEGVKGIVASRLARLYGVPTILFTINGDEARGSGRSVGSVNLFAAVESTSDLLTRFGGHEAAVGVTLPVSNLGEFTRRLCAYMDGLPEDEFHPREDIDACVELDELSLDAVGMLEKLAPFGQENPEPVFLVRNVTLTNRKAVGADKNHFSCVLANGRCAVGGIMFHCDEIDTFLHSDSIVDAVFTVQIDEWRGRRSVKAMLSGLYPARYCAVLEACLDPEARGFLEELFEDRSDLCSRMRKSDGDEDDADRDARDRQARRARWEKLAQDDPETLEKALIEAIIGDGELHPSQRTVLDRLRKGSSTLAIMATGRGKSLVFQVHAALLALKQHEASLFVYPLRALIADQAFHLENVLSRFGLACAVLTGENTSEERDAVYQGLAKGAVDVVLTTPEYFSCHVADISSAAHIGFVVVDEAHHIGLARAGHRSAYAKLGDLITQLGCSTVLAATATAPDEMADDIDSTLSLDGSVVDETERKNLTLDDQRNIKNRDAYLAGLIACGGKTVIYVNSREQSVAIARSLRRHVPQIAQLIGFYNAGLARSERCRIEELFRHDELMVLVATSAFGEGIDIPDIRHVVLYHLPFNEVEFSQMSGRAGRDGQPATIHLLYGRQDVSLNEGILAETTPDHDVMAQVYRHLRARQREAVEDYFCVEDEDLAQLAATPHAITLAAADCGVAVFCELGLIETRVSYEEGRPRRWIHVNEDAAKVDLSDSVRYREGMDERDVFKDFCNWAMNCDAQGIVARVTRPIIPRHRPGGC